MLIMLDNARDTDHVPPLLPGAPGCTVLVTRRNRMAGLVALPGARPLLLDVLDRQEAHRLLAGRLGARRPAAEPAAVDAIVVFFFQAEDGIRDGRVTGVQTCALPI